MPEQAEQLVIDETFLWRCGACAVRPILAAFGLNGGVYIKLRGRQSHSLHYVISVTELLTAGIKAHCPSCHAWRELLWDDAQQTMVDRAAEGYIPLIDCSCALQRIARARGNGHV